MANSPEEASLAKTMISKGRKKILLCDHTKLTAQGHFAYGVLQDFDVWITTPGMDAGIRENFARKVEILEAVIGASTSNLQQST